jgi:2-keto-4-pentenoate hydratase/2-oxohepta-3-ene-1,7-dioic acid hydratase in catechol pathway
MKILRYLDSQGQTHYASLGTDATAKKIEGDLFGDWTQTDQRADVQKVLAPISPRDIMCIGLNYRKHAAEGGQAIPEFPVLFMKNSSAVQNPGDPIYLPRKLASNSVDYECELAVIIGKPCYNVYRENALDYVLGYTCANDVTARDLQNSDQQWTRSKSFDTFCPLGPWIETELDPENLGISCQVNGVTKQDGNTSDLVRSAREMVSWISHMMTLLPGDVILTGTPAGVSSIVSGDSVSVTIEDIGTLTNSVTVR